MGRGWIKGRKFTDEHKRNIGLGNKGKEPTILMKKRVENIILNGIKPPVLFGEKNPRWKGGKTPLIQKIRSSFLYRQWRSDIFTRDNFTCQCCGDDRGGNLEADHIKPLSKIIHFYEIISFEAAIKCEELWNINNGKTLCKDCHKKTDTYGFKALKYIGRI